MQPELAQAAMSGEAASQVGFWGGGSPNLQGREANRKLGTPQNRPQGLALMARGQGPNK